MRSWFFSLRHVPVVKVVFYVEHEASACRENGVLCWARGCACCESGVLRRHKAVPVVKVVKWCSMFGTRLCLS
jgi:hypothetical protein